MQKENLINDRADTQSGGGGKNVKIVTACVVAVIVIVVTVMITFSLTVNYYFGYQVSELSQKIDVVKKCIDEYAYYDVDHEAMNDAALKAYVASVGDKYTTYYNAEDFKILNDDNAGRYVGIGVTVSMREVEYLNNKFSLLEVVKVYKNSPAEYVGMMSGDLIYSVVSDDGEILSDEVGIDVMTSMIKGEVGTSVTLCVLRGADNEYQKIEFVVERRNVEIESVEWTVYQNDASVGIVTISQFDLKTPQLFKRSMLELQQRKIEKIVIDLRNNGGGDLNSVIACASYFLDEGDVIVSAENNKGNVTTYKAQQRKYSGSYATCSVDKADIGLFKDANIVVLVNENTASAAELLTAVFRDHDVATIVGVNTYGKGTMQTIYSLKQYGLDGGIKITTDVYFPPCGKNYDGVGILPDVVVELESNEFDNQLQAAVDQFN